MYGKIKQVYPCGYMIEVVSVGPLNIFSRVQMEEYDENPKKHYCPIHGKDCKRGI